MSLTLTGGTIATRPRLPLRDLRSLPPSWETGRPRTDEHAVLDEPRFRDSARSPPRRSASTEGVADRDAEARRAGVPMTSIPLILHTHGARCDRRVGVTITPTG